MLVILLTRMRVLRLKWGITFTGMTLASGRGVFLSTVVLGAWVVLTGRASGPPRGLVFMLVVYGMAAGLVYGLVPRRPRYGVVRRPSVARVGFCVFVGGVGVPLFCALEAMPSGPDGQRSGVSGVVLATGLFSVVAYLVAQRRRGIRHRQGLPPSGSQWFDQIWLHRWPQLKTHGHPIGRPSQSSEQS